MKINIWRHLQIVSHKYFSIPLLPLSIPYQVDFTLSARKCVQVFIICV